MIIRSDLLSQPTKEKTKGNKQSENSQGFASVESSASETHTGNAETCAPPKKRAKTNNSTLQVTHSQMIIQMII